MNIQFWKNNDEILHKWDFLGKYRVFHVIVRAQTGEESASLRIELKSLRKFSFSPREKTFSSLNPYEGKKRKEKETTRFPSNSFESTTFTLHFIPEIVINLKRTLCLMLLKIFTNLLELLSRKYSICWRNDLLILNRAIVAGFLVKRYKFKKKCD